MPSHPEKKHDPAAWAQLAVAGQRFFEASVPARYSYNFTWLGRPIIQYPQDIMALQEIIWKVKPDLVIETGVAHGGSLILYASLLELLGNDGQVLGIDIDFRDDNRAELERHPLSRRIRIIDGSSVDPATFEQVEVAAAAGRNPLVVLDSNHTHAHVAAELALYAPLVKAGSYLVVMDTGIEDLPEADFADRPWGPGDNSKTAVWAFLKDNPRFEVDRELESKLGFTVAADGYLKCLQDP